MGIYEKIEKIRSKQENIRIRYVWFMVFISMACIVSLWWFSFKSKQIESKSSFSELRNSEIIPQFKEQKDSLKNSVNEARNVLDTQLKKQQVDSSE